MQNYRLLCNPLSAKNEAICHFSVMHLNHLIHRVFQRYFRTLQMGSFRRIEVSGQHRDGVASCRRPKGVAQGPERSQCIKFHCSTSLLRPYCRARCLSFRYRAASFINALPFTPPIIPLSEYDVQGKAVRRTRSVCTIARWHRERLPPRPIARKFSRNAQLNTPWLWRKRRRFH